jgi:hypothetical protein
MNSPTYFDGGKRVAGLAFANDADAREASALNIFRERFSGRDEDPTRHVSLQWHARNDGRADEGLDAIRDPDPAAAFGEETAARGR